MTGLTKDPAAGSAAGPVWRPCQWPGCVDQLDIAAVMCGTEPPRGWVTLRPTIGYLCRPHSVTGHLPGRDGGWATCTCGWVSPVYAETLGVLHELWRTHVRPVWLLDVDDVVNADRPGWGAAPYNTKVFSFRDGREYKLRWAPELLRRIRRVRRDAVEVVWCSTWCDEADILERLWGLPTLRRAFTGRPESAAARWELKVSAAERELADGRRVIWTDDELPRFGPVLAPFERAGALLIAPRRKRGLQPADMDAIEAYAHLLPAG